MCSCRNNKNKTTKITSNKAVTSSNQTTSNSNVRKTAEQLRLELIERIRRKQNGQ